MNYFLNNYGLSKIESKNDVASFDFSEILMTTPTSYIYGVIGSKNRRIQVKLLSISKRNENNYVLTGITKVSDNLNKFEGTITSRTIRFYEPNRFDMPYRSKVTPDNVGVAFFDYRFEERKEDQHSGYFEGILAVRFYIKDNKIFYNDIRKSADEFTNNEFVGTWTSFETGNSIICNWGDYRVPNVQGFDCGAAEFAPCDEFIQYGWQDYQTPKEWWK